ncbi:hypothetical protein [Nonomuraea dietziae]|uniref:Imidazolonepropionase-like amidohydrolase n=1 Tax=Nonomuraea dietziae TaxID=65515 RepID=A0A7W5YRJ4_9ACTN|nr:hypothetical protein [Nonomuraea dietziae]MBB3730972.1 imidazolonepropionase-like amidohydrolase [Nonomuraea dietziae]
MGLITADLLIPGDGQPVRQAAVVIENGLVRYAGSARNAPDTRGATHTSAPVVMPGLWDCHIHLFGAPDLDPARVLTVSPGLRAARCLP